MKPRIYGPNGEPAPLGEAQSSAVSGQARPDSVIYHGAKLDRAAFVNSPDRTILPGPAGILTVEKVDTELFLILDANVVLGWARTKAEAEKMVEDHHQGTMANILNADRREQERQERLAESKEDRWLNRSRGPGI